MKKILVSFILISMLAGCVANEMYAETTTTISPPSNKSTTSSTAPDITEINGNLSTQKVIWGPGRITDHQPPTDPVKLQKEYEKYGAYFLMQNKKTVYLTFDEGYENGFTPSILDTLKEKKVSAVFFVTFDFAKDNPDLIKRMIDEGHVVGNHTYRHKTMDEIDTQTATEEVMYLHNFIKENYNYEMKYFRFPKGEFSENALSLVNNLGYKSLFWSFAYADWDTSNVMNPDDAKEKITSSSHNGEIILLHAVSKTNAEILGDVIDDFQKQGYKFGKL